MFLICYQKKWVYLLIRHITNIRAQDPGQDALLSQYKHQYRTSVYLWLACHAHLGQDLASARSNAELALKTLSVFTLGTSGEDISIRSSNERKISGKSNERRDRNVRPTDQVSTTRIPRAPKAPQKKAPARKAMKIKGVSISKWRHPPSWN